MLPIPEKTNVINYYIAINEKESLSSWNNMNSAMSCLERFAQFKDENEVVKKNHDNIQGIIRVDSQGKKWVLKIAKII